MEGQPGGSRGHPKLRQVLDGQRQWAGACLEGRTPCTCPFLYPQEEACGGSPRRSWPAQHSCPPGDLGGGPGLGAVGGGSPVAPSGPHLLFRRPRAPPALLPGPSSLPGPPPPFPACQAPFGLSAPASGLLSVPIAAPGPGPTLRLPQPSSSVPPSLLLTNGLLFGPLPTPCLGPQTPGMERALEVFLATLNSLYRRETEARGSKDQAKAAELIPRTSAPAQCVVGGVWKALQKYLRPPCSLTSRSGPQPMY